MKAGASWDSRQTSATRKRARSNRILLFLLALLTVLSGCILPARTGPDRLAHACPVDMQATYYETLSEDDRILYAAVLEAVNRAETGDASFVPAPGADDSERVLDISWMVIYDHSECSAFWYEPKLSVRNGSEIRIRKTGPVDAKVGDGTYRVLVSCLKGRNDTETAWNVFSYLAEHGTYDFAPEPNPSSFSDDGLLRNGYAVCQGASFTFKRCMDAAGIPCTVFTAHTADGAYHMAATIELEGAWYVCDLSSALSGNPADYFCMDEASVRILTADLVMTPDMTVAD